MNQNNNQPKVDHNATAELVGALLKGFLFGDEYAVQQAPQPQPQQQQSPQPEPPPHRQNVQVTPPTPGAPVSGLMAANATMIELGPDYFGEPIRLDLIKDAIDGFNSVGLSLSDTTLLVAVLRALLIRQQGLHPESVDYTGDVALDMVDRLSSHAEKPA